MNWQIVLTCASLLGESAKRYAVEHTGIPVAIAAAVALAISWRIFKQAARLAIEIGIAVVLVVIATKLGWVQF